MKRWIFLSLCLALLGAASCNSFALGLIIVPEQEHWHPPVVPPIWPPPHPPHPPWPVPPPRVYPFAPLEVNFAKVNARITDQIAKTTVEQEFFNPNPGRLEGTFIFPVPKGAHLDKFTMEIDGKPVEAELLAADKARGIYEDIVRKLRDPALLEYADRDVFKVRIFPIEPHSKKRVVLSYTQLLKADGGLVAYALPLDTQKFSAKPIKSVAVKVELETKRPLKTIYSPSHKVEVRRDGPYRATAGYEASDVQPDADFALYFATEKDELGVSLMSYRKAGEDGYFMLLASPGVDVKEKQILPKDVAFVLDTSGSMAGKKIEQARKALQFCVDSLNDNDRFEIVRFSTEVEPLFGKLVDASKDNRAKAGDFIRDLKAIGGTAIDDALAKALALRPGGNFSLAPGFSPVSAAADLAGAASAASRGGEAVETASDSFHSGNTGLKPGANEKDTVKGVASRSSALRDEGDRPFVVIFLTDGRPTIGNTDENEIVAHVKKEAGSTRVFAFGIGTDVNTHLLDKITDETRAVSQYVLPEEDIEVKVSSFFAKIREPVLANPTLSFTGDVHTTKLYPSPLPDLFRGDQLVLVGRYSGKGDSAVVLEGSVNGATKKFTYEVKFPDEASDHEFIPRLWATRRVGYLLDEIRLHGENAELKDEVTDLARRYGIVTPYTAYLIVEDESRRGVPVPVQSLPQLLEDRPVRQLAAQNWDAFKDERAGEQALAGARYGYALKSATAAADAARSSSVEANRALGITMLPGAVMAAPAEDSKVRLAQYAQQTQFVAGKNFFQNDKQWVDSAAQKFQNAKRVRIQFNSPEYFAFAAKNAKALPWLALGQNVQFVLESTIYEIFE